jgi:hypothetical protein
MAVDPEINLEFWARSKLDDIQRENEIPTNLTKDHLQQAIGPVLPSR